LTDLGHIAFESLSDDCLSGRPGERGLTHQHLVEHRAQAVDIRAAVEIAIPCRLLRAHVGRGPDAHASLGELIPAFAQGAGDAEVGHQGAAVLCQEQVFGLDVTVHDTVLVGILQGSRGIGGYSEGIVHRELRFTPEPVAQRLALDVRHGEPQLANGFARVEHGQDVGVLEPCGGLDLASEAVRAERLSQLGVEDLESDRPLVSEVVGQEHRGHAAAPELALEAVAIY
jgi:hypothetical protein